MKQLKQQFVDSWHELKKTKVMAVTAMLSRRCGIGFFSVQLTDFIRTVFPYSQSWHRCCSVRWLAGLWEESGIS